MENPIVQNNPHIQPAHGLLNNINAEGLSSAESNQTQPEQPHQIPSKAEQDPVATQEENQSGEPLNQEGQNKENDVEEEQEEIKSPSQKFKERSPHLKQLTVDTQYAFQPTTEPANNATTEASSNPNPDAPLSEADMAGSKKCYSNCGVQGAGENNPNDKDQQKVIGLKRVNSVTNLESPTKPKPEENKQEPASANQKQKISINDFTKVTGLGKGSYAEVFLVKKNANGKLYALKALDKNFMLKVS